MDTNILKKVYIFSSLSGEELDNLGSICRYRKYNKGDIIFFDTEPYRGFYIVVSGLVKIYKIANDGKEHILHLVEPFNTFAEVPLFENYGSIKMDEFRYPANSMALEDATDVVLVPAQTFTELIENNSKISLKLISGFAKRLRHLNKHIEDLTLKDVTKRVAGYILAEFQAHKKTANASSKSVSLMISKNDLSSYLGTIPETLSRTLKKLHDENVIEVDGKTIVITDIDKLKEAAA